MSAPVKNTCPDIDKVIKELLSIQREAEYGMKEHERDTDDHQRYKDIEWPIDQIIDQLEDLRTANAALRDWGEELEYKVANLEDEKYLIEQQLEELKSATP